MKFSRLFLVITFSSFLLVSCGSDKDGGSDGPGVVTNETTPENEENSDSSSSSTIKKSRCYEGSPESLVLMSEVRVVRENGPKKTYLYDCQGTNTCQRTVELVKSSEGSGDESMSCLQSSDGSFSLCAPDGRNVVDTQHGPLLELGGVRDGGAFSAYCKTSIPI